MSTSKLLDVLDYWFEFSPDYQKWFFQGKQIDGIIRERFSKLHQEVSTTDYRAVTLREKLAKIILLDQFSRHIYRGQAEAFANDAAALTESLALLASKEIDKLSACEQVFALMPLQHSENLVHSDILLKFALKKANKSSGEDLDVYKSLILHTKAHQGILRDFGRYPKRNVALGRTSTPEEILYLQKFPNRAY